MEIIIFSGKRENCAIFSRGTKKEKVILSVCHWWKRVLEFRILSTVNSRLAHHINSVQKEQKTGCLKNLATNLCPLMMWHFCFRMASVRKTIADPLLHILVCLESCGQGRIFSNRRFCGCRLCLSILTRALRVTVVGSRKSASWPSSIDKNESARTSSAVGVLGSTILWEPSTSTSAEDSVGEDRWALVVEQTPVIESSSDAPRGAGSPEGGGSSPGRLS